MTVQLFRSDAYLSSFEAVVVQVREGAVCLSQTAFYPGGGGQVYDLGTLNGVPVQKTSLEEGKIWHHLDTDLSLGAEVHGQLDWARRFDAMQQHTGEHLLGQAFFSAWSACSGGQYGTLGLYFGFDRGHNLGNGNASRTDSQCCDYSGTAN